MYTYLFNLCTKNYSKIVFYEYHFDKYHFSIELGAFYWRAGDFNVYNLPGKW